MNNKIQNRSEARTILETERSPNEKSQVNSYIDWLEQNEFPWYKPDLEAYRDFLLDECDLSPSSVAAYLSSVRGRYKRICRDRDLFYSYVDQNLPMSEQKAIVDEVVARIENAIDPLVAPVARETVQDQNHVRLTSSQAEQLLSMPGISTLPGLRDTAIISLFLCTGIREGELCSLSVPHAETEYENMKCLEVRHGKGNKQRIVPYGELEWALTIAKRWMENAGIESGKVFRRILKDQTTVGAYGLTARAIQDILKKYPIIHKGKLIHVRPHDLRRTYARRLYDAGVDPIRIQQNLGHNSLSTTLKYIGDVEASKRAAPLIYNPIGILEQL